MFSQIRHSTKVYIFPAFILNLVTIQRIFYLVIMSWLRIFDIFCFRIKSCLADGSQKITSLNLPTTNFHWKHMPKLFWQLRCNQNLRGPNSSLRISSYRFLNKITSCMLLTIAIPILLAQSTQKTSEECLRTVGTSYTESIYVCTDSCRRQYMI